MGLVVDRLGKRSREDVDSSSRRVKPQFEQNANVVDRISDEILLLIFEQLDPASLLKAGQTCKRFANVTSDCWKPGQFNLLADPLDSTKVYKRSLQIIDLNMNTQTQTLQKKVNDCFITWLAGTKNPEDLPDFFFKHSDTPEVGLKLLNELFEVEESKNKYYNFMIENNSVHKLLDILRNADYPEEDLAAILSRPNELSYVAVIDLLAHRDIKNISAFFNIMRKLIKSVIHTDQTVILLGKFSKEERDALFAEAVKARSLEVNLDFSRLIEKERRLITDCRNYLSLEQKRSVLKHVVSLGIAQSCFRHQYELANDIFGNKYAARSKKIFDTLALNLKQNAIPLIDTMFTQSW